ncbi:InlB B-repeat-containing protein, partial [Oscillibacter valericigenes]|uniref:InlB B-repeat-containing protein n=1 Tax=Oscillibacter valericigenes TaxID=351091 RepID=UPI001F180AF7
MAKVRKRILSLVMSLVMVFTLLPTTALAGNITAEKTEIAVGETIELTCDNDSFWHQHGWHVTKQGIVRLEDDGNEVKVKGLKAGTVTVYCGKLNLDGNSVTITVKGSNPNPDPDPEEPEATKKVFVYVMDDGWEGNSDFEDLVGLHVKDDNGYFPVGVAYIPASVFAGSSPYLKASNWETVKVAVENTLDTSTNSFLTNRNNNMAQYLDNVDTTQFGGAGSEKTGLFDWRYGVSYGFENDSADYHLDLRLESCQVQYKLANTDIKGHPQGEVLASRGYFANFQIKEPSTSGDWYLTLPEGTAVAGYYTDESCTEEYQFGQTVSDDVTVWVKLEWKTFDITYDLNGGNIDGSTDDVVYYNQNYGTATPEPDENPVKEGYIFDGWEPDVANWVTEDVTYTAQWKASNATYKVKHYQQNLNDANYTLKETENKVGTTGATVEAVAKSYDGFTYDSTVEGTVSSGIVTAGEELTLKLYYTRNEYALTIHYVYADGSEAAPDYTDTLYYEEAYNVTSPSPSITGYKPDKATVSGTMPAKDVEVTVTYTKDESQTKTLSYTVEYYKDNVKVDA